MLRLSIIVITLSHALYADPVIIEPSQGAYPIDSVVEYFEDPSGDATIEEVIGRSDSSWTLNQKRDLNFSYTKSAYWIRFTVTNQLKNESQFWLELVSLVDDIRLYTQIDDRWTEKKTGRWDDITTRDLKHRNFLFNLEIPSQAQKTFYMRFQSTGALLLPLTIYTQKEFSQKDHEEQYVYGIYFGLMIVMILYNLFVFFSVKDISYLWYVTYIFWFVIFQQALWGFGHENLWSNLWWANHSLPFSISMATLFSVLFALSFLELRKKFKVLFYIMIGVAILALSVGILSLLPPYDPRKAIITGMGSSVLMLSSSLILLFKGYRPARFFALAWVALILGVLVIGLRNFGVLPFHFLTNYSNLIGSAAEVVLLSLALADRINILKREKEEIQEAALKQLKRLSDSFARFVPKEFLHYLNKEDITDVSLGDAVQERMTILFSDIRDFTSFSERMEPRENFEFINAFLGRVGPIIRNYHGFIDKYIGDAIMALFPSKPDDAIAAARELLAELERYNVQRKERGYEPIRVGIGIHTGTLMLGTVGEKERMETTVISDSVNLASRIENLTRKYDVPIVISEQAKESMQSRHDYIFQFLDSIQVKGKEIPVSIYTIHDMENK